MRSPLRPLTASPSPSLAFPQSLHNSKNISHVSRRCQTSRSCGQEKNSRTEDNSFNLTADPFGRVGWGQNTRRYSVTLQQPCGAGATAPPLHDEEAEPQRSHRTHWTVVRPGSSRAGAGARWPQSLGARPQGHPAWTPSHRATPPGHSATGPPRLGARPRGHPAWALGHGATPPGRSAAGPPRLTSTSMSTPRKPGRGS